MRIIDVSDVTAIIEQSLLQINTTANEHIIDKYQQLIPVETNVKAANIMKIFIENNRIASSEHIPLCQDTGMVIVNVEMGQDVHLENGDINEAINQGIRNAYIKYNFRKSVVDDPLFERINTKDNTPGVIYYHVSKGEHFKMQIMAKGFGSENVSQSCMFKPTSSVDDIKDFIIEVVKKAGPNACPPYVIGVGIGGTLDKAALMAKMATAKENYNDNINYANLEKTLEIALNQTNIGPLGIGGLLSVLQLRINYYPTHIAGLPVVVNICCHQSRHIEVNL